MDKIEPASTLIAKPVTQIPYLRLISLGIGLLAMFLALIFFLTLGNIYTRSKPAEDYYNLKQPVILDKKEYPACGDKALRVDMAGKSTRTATFSGIVDVRKELFKLNALPDGNFEEQETGIVIMNSGNIQSDTNRPVNFTFYYYCGSTENFKVVPGRYIWKSVTHFEIGGNSKDYSWDTESFIVK